MKTRVETTAEFYLSNDGWRHYMPEVGRQDEEALEENLLWISFALPLEDRAYEADAILAREIGAP